MRSVSSELLGRLWIANTYWPALKIVPNGAIGDSEDFTWPRNARCCDMEDWPDADELDICNNLLQFVTKTVTVPGSPEPAWQV